MSAPRFLPLQCLSCSGDLTGRAIDRLAFCLSCQKTFLCDDPGLSEIHSIHTTLLLREKGNLLPVPFWLRGGIAVPAFLTPRTLTLARVVTKLYLDWPGAEGPGEHPPLGARLPPAALETIARLARLAPGNPGGGLVLLAVPLLIEGKRYRLPGWDGELFADDIPEGTDLIQHLREPALR